MRLPISLAALSLFAVSASAAATVPPRTATPHEIEVGDKAVKQFEAARGVKIMPSDTPEHRALSTKINDMARELGAASLRPGIKYNVKVVEAPDVNAFTLPNGHIYVFRGLLDLVGSDDELAAVIAHEIGHNAKMHALRGEAKAKKMNLASMAALAAMMAGGSNGANVGAFSQYLMIGVMNRYSLGYEKEADEAGIEEMARTRWNPSAMVTMMQRFATIEQANPEEPAGIFQDHPAAPERVQAGMDALKRLNIEYTPRKVSGGAQAQAVIVPDRAQVKMGDLVLCEFAAKNASDVFARKRAEAAAVRINALLRDGLMLTELSIQPDGDGVALVARGQVVARCTARDAQLSKSTPQTVVAKWRAAFQTVFWREQISGKLS